MIPREKVSLIRLENWCNMEYVHDYLNRNGAFNNNVSREGYNFLSKKYFFRLSRRITYCENIEPKSEFVFFTLAQLYDRVDADESKENLYRRKSRFYAIKAIRNNPKYSRAWALLGHIYTWVSLLGGNEKGKDRSAHFAEKAITCLKNAIKYNPENKKYREDLKSYYHLRNEEYA
jgi:hypothetical protein